MKTITCTSKPAKEDKREPEIEKKDADEEIEKKDADEDEEKPDDEADDEEEDKPDKKKRGKPARKGVAKKSKAERKRGPARPYRNLPQDTLDTRIKKLEKRIERTSAQAEEGRNFLVKYTREQAFRDAEALPAAA